MKNITLELIMNSLPIKILEKLLISQKNKKRTQFLK